MAEDRIAKKVGDDKAKEELPSGDAEAGDKTTPSRKRRCIENDGGNSKSERRVVVLLLMWGEYGDIIKIPAESFTEREMKELSSNPTEGWDTNDPSALKMILKIGNNLAYDFGVLDREGDEFTTKMRLHGIFRGAVIRHCDICDMGNLLGPGEVAVWVGVRQHVI